MPTTKDSEWNLRSLLIGMLTGAVLSGVGSYAMFESRNAVQDERITTLITTVEKLATATQENTLAIASLTKR